MSDDTQRIAVLEFEVRALKMLLGKQQQRTVVAPPPPSPVQNHVAAAGEDRAAN